jgi:hypothetical protein
MEDYDSSPNLSDDENQRFTLREGARKKGTNTSKRPSRKDGARVIKPEIIIEIGSKKGKGKKYQPGSSKYNTKSSLGAYFANPDDASVESLGSDSSYSIRTGFPEEPNHPTYTKSPREPKGHRRNSLDSLAGQPPSMYATSDSELPAQSHTPRYPPTIVHHRPPSPREAPDRGRFSTYPDVGSDGISSVDDSGFAGSNEPRSSRAVGPEITRRQREARKRQQEETDRKIARQIAVEEEARQARVELERAEARARERAENPNAELERRRFEERDEEVRRETTRRRKHEDEEEVAS